MSRSRTPNLNQTAPDPIVSSPSAKAIRRSRGFSRCKSSSALGSLEATESPYPLASSCSCRRVFHYCLLLTVLSFSFCASNNKAQRLPAANVTLIHAGRGFALGTDGAVYPRDLNAGEFWCIVELGISPVRGSEGRDSECGGPSRMERQDRIDRAGQFRRHRRGARKSSGRYFSSSACAGCDEG